MTEEAIFVDSTVFLAFLIDGKDVFDSLKGHRLVTSTSVVEEVTYVLIKERAKILTRIERHYDLLRHLRKNHEIVKMVAEEVINDVSTILDVCGIHVVSPLRPQFHVRNRQRIRLTSKRRFDSCDV